MIAFRPSPSAVRPSLGWARTVLCPSLGSEAEAALGSEGQEPLDLEHWDLQSGTLAKKGSRQDAASSQLQRELSSLPACRRGQNWGRRVVWVAQLEQLGPLVELEQQRGAASAQQVELEEAVVKPPWVLAWASKAWRCLGVGSTHHRQTRLTSTSRQSLLERARWQGSSSRSWLAASTCEPDFRQPLQEKRHRRHCSLSKHHWE